MESSGTRHALVLAAFILVVGTVASLAFRLVFDHRTDYVGHFAAGFGGTLGLLTLLVASNRQAMSTAQVHLVALIVALVSIGLGTVTEATIFRIAQFDPVDFCNQSLGAILAGMAFVAARPPMPIGPASTVIGFVLSILFLIAGFVLAFA